MTEFCDDEMIRYAPTAFLRTTPGGHILQRNAAYATLFDQNSDAKSVSELPYALKNALKLAIGLADTGPPTAFEISTDKSDVKNVYALSARKVVSGNIAIWIENLSQLHAVANQLKQVKNDFDIATQAFPDLYFWIRSDGTIYRCLLGQQPFVPEASFLHRRMQDVLPPTVGAQFQAAITLAFREEKAQTILYSLPVGSPPRDGCYEARIIPSNALRGLIIVRDLPAPP